MVPLIKYNRTQHDCVWRNGQPCCTVCGGVPVKPRQVTSKFWCFNSVPWAKYKKSTSKQTTWKFLLFPFLNRYYKIVTKVKLKQGGGKRTLVKKNWRRNKELRKEEKEKTQWRTKFFLKSWQFHSLSRHSPHFINKGSLTCSQSPTFRPNQSQMNPLHALPFYLWSIPRHPSIYA